MYDITNEREVIREIKKYLFAVAVNVYPEIGRTTIDNFYDAATAEAVRKFQTIKKLPVTGEVNYPTFNALYSDYVLARILEHGRDYVLEDYGFPVVFGDMSEDARAINMLINELAKVHTDVGNVGTGAFFSERSVKAVKRLREIFRMPAGAEVDAELFERMLTELASHKRNKKTDDLKGGGWV